jgi:hypothetical protein
MRRCSRAGADRALAQHQLDEATVVVRWDARTSRFLGARLGAADRSGGSPQNVKFGGGAWESI